MLLDINLSEILILIFWLELWFEEISMNTFLFYNISNKIILFGIKHDSLMKFYRQIKNGYFSELDPLLFLNGVQVLCDRLLVFHKL